MIRLLQWLFMGHCHKWKTLSYNPLRIMDGGETSALGYRYIQQCEKCGIVTKRDLV